MYLCMTLHHLVETGDQSKAVLAAQLWKEEKNARIHHTLQEIIVLAPTGISELYPGKNTE